MFWFCWHGLVYARLNVLIDVVTTNVGVNTSSCLDFTLNVTYCYISYVTNIMLLLAVHRDLSNHFMDWFRVWYKTQIKDLIYYVVSYYLLQILQAWIKDKHEKRGQNFVQFLEKKLNDISQGWTFQRWSSPICLQRNSTFLYWAKSFLYPLIHYGQLGYKNKITFIHILSDSRQFGEDFRLDWLSGRVALPRIFGIVCVFHNNILNGTTVLFFEMYYGVLFHK